MQILTAADMQETDRRTIDDFGVGIDTLMDRAGWAVFQFCTTRYPIANQVVVLCGKGNNGGDGLVAARYLARSGRSVTVLLLGQQTDLKGPPARALNQLLADTSTATVVSLSEDTASAQLDHALNEADLILDAVVGTGFKPPLRGTAALIRDKLAESATSTRQVPVVAVDLPSGWDADSMQQTFAGAFRADAVVTFTAPKTAHVFGHLTNGALDGGTFGPVVVAEIGSPEAAILATTRQHWTGSAKAIAQPPRAMNSNKGKFGHVLVVGGSYGKAGAAMMASLSALRTGAGLVTAAVPKSILNTVAQAAPELMMEPLAEGEEGAVSFKNLEGVKLDSLLKKVTVVALGPGLSTVGDAPAFARQIVEKTTLPIVIDADALNAFEGKENLLNGEGRVVVLTPHPGEMARLVGMTVKQVEADRVGLARRFATEHHLTLVLKGWRTLVAHPDGTIAVNTTGNPAMAKGGSGDILTGIVAAMLAQYPDNVALAVEAAVYLHGLAGDLAAIAMDEHTVLATDTVAHLSGAFRYRVKDADGLTWICGFNGAEKTMREKKS
jgi:hydroxyethylthiazole kinase-like uncharacterized protein yjeF